MLLSVEKDGEQNVRSAHSGDNQAEHGPDCPQEHLKVAVLLVRDVQSITETPDSAGQKRYRDRTENYRENEVEVLHRLMRDISIYGNSICSGYFAVLRSGSLTFTSRFANLLTGPSISPKKTLDPFF